MKLKKGGRLYIPDCQRKSYWWWDVEFVTVEQDESGSPFVRSIDGDVYHQESLKSNGYLPECGNEYSFKHEPLRKMMENE